MVKELHEYVSECDGDFQGEKTLLSLLLVELAGDQLHQPPLHGRGAATAYEPYQG